MLVVPALHWRAVAALRACVFELHGDALCAAFDWSPDKEGLCVMGSYDQSVRVCVVTKLNKL